MTGESLSSIWSVAAPAVANHLWQSTLFAIAAALMVLLLRKQNARIRHWLWMVTSLKFLVPFSLLVSIGTRLSHTAAPALRPVVYYTIDEISRPFTQIGVPVTPAHAPAVALSILPHLTPLLLGVWLVG